MKTKVAADEQVEALAFGGRLRGNKPAVGGLTATGHPSSSLFYWSHSRFGGDVEFGLHPHEGFEIMTFVLDGENSHFDTATQRWTPLHAGDVQVIASGHGLSHSEKVAAGSRAFQIWFDPDVRRAITVPPSYRDHPAASFTPRRDGAVTVTDLVGGDGPIESTTEGLAIRRVRAEEATAFELALGPDRFGVVYAMIGSVDVDGLALAENDIALVEDEATVVVTFRAGSEVFVVDVPVEPSYRPLIQR